MITSNIKIAAAISYLTIVLNVVSGLILTPAMITALGTSDYGLYTLVGGIVALLASFDFGMTATITRFTARFRAAGTPQELEKVIAAIQLFFLLCYLLVIGGGLVYIHSQTGQAVLGLSEAESEKALVLLAIMLASVPTLMQSALYQATCNGYEKFIFARSLVFFRSLIRMLIILALLGKWGDSIAIALVDLAVSVASALAGAYYVRYRLKLQPHFRSIPAPLIKELGTYSLWIFLYAMAVQFFWKIGQVEVGAAFGLVAVTLYAIGVMLGTYYGSFVTAFANMFLPQAARLTNKDAGPDELIDACITIGQVNLGTLAIMYLGFFLLGRSFISLWLPNTVDHAQVWLISMMIMTAYTLPLSQSFFNNILEAKGLIRFKALMFVIALPGSVFVAAHIPQVTSVAHYVLVMVSAWLLCQLCMNVYYATQLHLNVGRFFLHCYGLWGLVALIAFLAFKLFELSSAESWFQLVMHGALFAACFAMAAAVVFYPARRLGLVAAGEQQ